MIRSSNLFCVLWVGKPQTALKAVLRAGFVSSLASFGMSVARVTCQCAYEEDGLMLEDKYSLVSLRLAASMS